MCIWWLVYVFIAAMCFSKFCICTVNVVLSLSTLSSGMATSRHETFLGTCAEGQMGAMLRVVCFVGCVRDVLRGREHKDGGRLQISVMSSSAVRKCHLKVPGKVFLLRCLRMIGSMSIWLMTPPQIVSWRCRLPRKRLNKVLGVSCSVQGSLATVPFKKKNVFVSTGCSLRQ